MKCSWIAMVALVASLAAPASGAAVCDIRVDPSFPLYMVTVDGQPFKKKRYVDPSDALALRDVLVDSGLCNHTKKLQRCSVREAAEGQYVVYRGDIHFDPMRVFNAPKGANRHARQLASARLCNFD